MVASQDVYLKQMDDLRSVHLPPPSCSDEEAAIPPADAKTRKKLVMYQDESIINVNDGQT